MLCLCTLSLSGSLALSLWLSLISRFLSLSCFSPLSSLSLLLSLFLSLLLCLSLSLSARSLAIVQSWLSLPSTHQTDLSKQCLHSNGSLACLWKLQKMES